MERTSRPWAALIVLCLGTFVILLDTTIVNVALPSVITSLHATLDQGVWVLNAYLLVFCALLIPASRLGGMFGSRLLFTAGLGLFAVASALCGAAQSPGQLIAFRALQGIGAAALAPQANVIIQAIFPRARMGTAFGVLSSMVGLAAVSGPVLGGVLTTYLSWRWVFYVNLPIIAAGIVLTYVFVPDVRIPRPRGLDLPGVLFSSAGLSALVYGLIEGQRYNWGEVTAGVTIPEIIGAGIVVLAGFVIWEHFQPDPLVPLGLFRDRTFAIMVLLSVAVQFALQSMLLVNAINLQSVLGFTAVRAGLTSLPLTLALTALAPFAGRLTDRMGGKYVLMAGLTVYAAGIAALAAVSTTHSTMLTFAPALLVAGLGMGAIFAPVATMGMRAAPSTLAGAASGILTTGRQLGGVLGGAVTGAVLAGQLASAMRSRALTDSQALPATARKPFINGVSATVRSGLQVGRGQSATQVPHGTPASLVPRLRRLAADVFSHGYITAMHPTLAVPVALLLAGAAGCLLLPRHTPPGSAGRSQPSTTPTASKDQPEGALS